MVSKPKGVLNKMSWNYRVINYGNSFYIGEVYYNKNGKFSMLEEALSWHLPGSTLLNG